MLLRGVFCVNVMPFKSSHASWSPGLGVLSGPSHLSPVCGGGGGVVAV